MASLHEHVADGSPDTDSTVIVNDERIRSIAFKVEAGDVGDAAASQQPDAFRIGLDPQVHARKVSVRACFSAAT
jgi:leucyl aminopeptidase (aminopeptidase T)